MRSIIMIKLNRPPSSSTSVQRSLRIFFAIFFTSFGAEADAASLIFPNQAYFVNGPQTLEANTWVLGQPIGGTKFLFISEPPGDLWFSGNNVRGRLYAIDASNNVSSFYFGEVTRLVKIGSNVIACQFYVYPNSNSADRQSPAQTLLINFSGTFTSGQTLKTSSDPVATVLNNLLSSNAAPAASADTDTALMPSCSAGQGRDTAIGNVISGAGSDANPAGADTDASINYSFNPNPPLTEAPFSTLVESGDTLRISAVRSNLSGASAAVSSSQSPAVTGHYGTLQMASGGDYTYTINAQNAVLLALAQGQSISEAFTYTVTDGKGGISTSTLTLTIYGGNAAPSASNDYGLVNASISLPSTLVTATAATRGVLLNDSDADVGASITVTRAEKAASLTDETFTTPMTVTQTGSTSFSRTLSFTYSGVSQGANWGGSVGDAVFIRRSGQTNWANTGLFIHTKTTGGPTKLMTFRTSASGIVQDGFLDFKVGDSLSFVTAGTHIGTISEVTLSTQSTTQFALTDTGTIPVAGDNVNGQGVQAGTKVSSVHTLTGVGTYVTLDQTVTASSTINGTTLNEGESLSFVSGEVIQGTFGYLNLRSDGSYEYVQTLAVPTSILSNEYFKYEISDGGCIDMAVLHLQIIPVQVIPPVGRPDAKSVTETGVIPGNSPADGNVLTDGTADTGTAPLNVTQTWHPVAATSASVIAGSTSTLNASNVPGLYGQLFIGSNGSYRYVLDDSNPMVDALQQGSSLTEVFHYQVNDGNTPPEFGFSTLTITIQGTNDAPLAIQNAATAIEEGGRFNGTPGYDPVGNLFLNDTDVDANDSMTLDGLGTGAADALGDANSGEYVVNGTYGTLYVRLDGSYRYELNQTSTDVEALAVGETLSDVFNYRVIDSLLATNTSTLTITILGADDLNLVEVDSTNVNEGSPFAVFTITGAPSQSVSLILEITGQGEGDATRGDSFDFGTTTGTGLEYFNGAVWVTYAGGVVALDANGKLLVRTPIRPDALYEEQESFLLNATTLDNNTAVGAGVIFDDGTGGYFAANNNTSTSSLPVGVVLDEDRSLTVSSPTVNEASPWAVFAVTGVAEQQLTLSLTEGSGTGFANIDETQPLQYWDASANSGVGAWVNYTAGSLVTIPTGGTLLVRVDITQESDTALDGPETFHLVATNTGGSPYSGAGSIVDDGTGDYWIADSTTPATPQNLVDAAIVLDDDRLRDHTIKWGIANADPFNSLIDATIISNDTSTPLVYAGMDQGQFDLHMTVAGLASNSLKMLGGEASWSMSPKTSLSTTTFRFYQPGTTTPQAVRNIHFSIEDAEFGEELSNFSYWDANGTKVTLPWSDSAFTYSATPLFRSNGTVVENGSNFENNTQSGKHIRIDLRGVLVSGLEFNFRKRLSSAGSIVLTHLTGSPGKLEFGGVFSPLNIKANAAGLGEMPDYRTQTTRQAGVVGTVTQDPAPGALLPVGDHAVKLTLTTADDSANIGFDMTIRARRPSVVEITGPVAGSVSITGDAPLLPLTGTVRDWEGEGIAAVEVTYGGQTLSATVGTPDRFGISTWSLPITPVSGTNIFSVSAVDVNGIRSLTATRTFEFTRRYSFAVTANPTAGTVKAQSTHPTATRSMSLLSTVGATSTYSVLPTANISLSAKALAGYVFSHWSGIPAGATAVPGSMRLVMPAADITGVEAHFVATPFIAPAGTSNTFYGLLKPVDAANTSNDSVAMLTGTLVPKSGTFSGRIALGGLTHRFTCTFAGNGTSWFSLDHNAPANSFTLPSGHVLDLSFDTINGTVIAALSKGGVISQGVIQRSIYTSTNPVPQNLLNLRAPSTLVQNNLGFYTAAIPAKVQAPARTPSTYPQGDGFTTITMRNNGTLTLSGVLADGSTITASTALVTGDVSPFFAQLTTPGATTRNGSFSGSLNFVPGTDSDVTGTDLLWVRPTVIQENGPTKVATQLYTEGWPSGIRVDLVGAFYDTAVNVQAGLGLPSPNNTQGNGELNFSLGKLVSDVSVTAFNITTNTVAKLQPKDRTFQLLVNGPRATFGGTFTPNWTPRVPALPAFRGILLQKGTDGPAGYGFFLSNRGTELDPESGRATLGVQN
jgi:VCBS repeat-containing protein